jgi:peptidoglycan hydrolase CwlO-like protein
LEEFNVEFTDPSVLGGAVGLLVTLGSAYLTVRKIARDAKKEKKEFKAEIVQSAKEEIALKEKDLEAKIKDVDNKVNALKESVEKDLAHMKDTFNSEIRNLGQKVEDLRDELRSQHTQMVALLTKMIDNSKE